MWMKEHIVRAFTDELEQLSADILSMGGLAESMITDACDAVITGDTELGQQIIDLDRRVDRYEIEIERQITRMLALRQPMARDLREVLSALRISSELERVGDLSKSIAKRITHIDAEDNRLVLQGVSRIGKAVAQQLNLVLDAYAGRNVDLALQVWTSDEDVDRHYNGYFREVLTYMMEDPRIISEGTHILFIAKNLERIGDHCTNIAEHVYYLVTGSSLIGDERPKVSDINV
ncbi:MAG: phosphate signaling complex protein PhoU [Pseudomonadota bacterium]